MQNRDQYFSADFNNKKNLINIRKSKDRIAKFEINNVFFINKSSASTTTSSFFF